MSNSPLLAAYIHDQNNFLQVVIFQAEALKSYLLHDEAGSQELNKLFQALEGMRQMNRAALDDFSHTQEDRSVGMMAPDEVIRRTVALAKLCNSKDAQIKVNLSALEIGMPIPQIHLQQVLFNLLKNALEAVPDKKGNILVESSIQPHGGRDLAQPHGQALCITITDNGPGIPEMIRDQIFDCGVTSKAEGHGLGLYHARKIVNRYGGSITLCQSHVFGTRATLLWPMD